jgi:hypothetical protein
MCFLTGSEMNVTVELGPCLVVVLLSRCCLDRVYEVCHFRNDGWGIVDCLISDRNECNALLDDDERKKADPVCRSH